MRKRPEDESVMLCVLVRCEKPGLDRPNISVLSSISQRIMIGRAGSVTEEPSKAAIFSSGARAMTYSKGDNGRVARS